LEHAHGAIADPTEAKNAKKKEREKTRARWARHTVAEIW
jgi:hypothetical protein